MVITVLYRKIEEDYSTQEIRNCVKIALDPSANKLLEDDNVSWYWIVNYYLCKNPIAPEKVISEVVTDPTLR